MRDPAHRGVHFSALASRKLAESVSITDSPAAFGSPLSEETKPEVNPDDLTKTTEPESTELTEEELNRVSGGVSGGGGGAGKVKFAGWDVKALDVKQ